jgi:hypothetical protein
MTKPPLDLIAAASGLTDGRLAELVTALTRLKESRAGDQAPRHTANRVIVEQRQARFATLRLELVKCGKPLCRVCKALPAHGPYWYAYWKHKGRTCTKYLGKTLPESFMAYEKDLEGGGYIGMSLSAPRSYVTSRKPKKRRLHKTTVHQGKRRQTIRE